MIAGQGYTCQVEDETGFNRELKDDFVTVNMATKTGVETRIVGSQVWVVAEGNGSGPRVPRSWLTTRSA